MSEQGKFDGPNYSRRKKWYKMYMHGECRVCGRTRGGGSEAALTCDWRHIQSKEWADVVANPDGPFWVGTCDVCVRSDRTRTGQLSVP